MTAVTKDGIPRRAVIRAPILAVSADTLVSMLDLKGYGPLEAMRKQEGFPPPIYPSGTSTPRWIVSEVRKWLTHQAPRVSKGRKKYHPRKARAIAAPTATTPTTQVEVRPEPAEVIQ